MLFVLSVIPDIVYFSLLFIMKLSVSLPFSKLEISIHDILINFSGAVCLDGHKSIKHKHKI